MTRAGYLKWREGLKHFHAAEGRGDPARGRLPGRGHCPRPEPESEEEFPAGRRRAGTGRCLMPGLSRTPIQRPRQQDDRGQDDQRLAEGVAKDDPRVASVSAQAFLQPTAAGLARQGAQALQFEAAACSCRFGAGLTGRGLSFSRRRARNFPYARFSKTPIPLGSLSRYSRRESIAHDIDAQEMGGGGGAGSIAWNPVGAAAIRRVAGHARILLAPSESCPSGEYDFRRETSLPALSFGQGRPSQRAAGRGRERQARRSTPTWAAAGCLLSVPPADAPAYGCASQPA